MSYLIDANSYNNVDYLQQLKKRDKAVSADIVSKGAVLEDVIYQNGYKLEHIFLDGTSLEGHAQESYPFKYKYNLRAVI